MKLSFQPTDGVVSEAGGYADCLATAEDLAVEGHEDSAHLADRMAQEKDWAEVRRNLARQARTRHSGSAQEAHQSLTAPPPTRSRSSDDTVDDTAIFFNANEPPRHFSGPPQIITTSLTTQYAESWGVERIALDGIQNHLPTDSKGTEVVVEFLIGDRWIPLTEKSRVNPEAVEAIRFRDNGVGFTYEKLELLFSGKKKDDTAVGEFGEGLKMLTATCLREGMPVELYSRDWCAVPFTRERTLDGEMAQQVCYEVKTGAPAMTGSMTVIRKPSADLIRYTLQLEQKVLPLRRDYTPVFHTPNGDIVDESGDLYVKGVFINDAFNQELLFGYNLATALNRDRNKIEPFELHNAIAQIIRKLDDMTLIKRVIKAAHNTMALGGKPTPYMEFSALFWDKSSSTSSCGGMFLTHPTLWKNAFHEIFGAQAVLSGMGDWRYNGQDPNDADRLARIQGYKVIKLNKDVIDMLRGTGVQTSFDVAHNDNSKLLGQEDYDPDHVRMDHVESGITLDYRAKKWRERRVVLDYLANHMPKDSGGTELPKIGVLVVSEGSSKQQPKWIEIRFKQPSDKILAIRFSDEGRGYDSDVLGVFYSTKVATSGSVGQFGEGLDMASAASLRLQAEHDQLYVKLRSRDWVAMPFAVDAVVNQQPTKKLFYSRAQGLTVAVGATTSIFNPTPEMIRIVEQLASYVLPYNSTYHPLYESAAGAIFEGNATDPLYPIPKGSIYVKDFLVTTELADHLLFSYNFQTSRINPDRDMADISAVKEDVRTLMAGCHDKDIIRRIVAEGEIKDDLFEFQTINFGPGDGELRKLYREAFYEAYGTQAVLYTEDPFVFAVVKHIGYKPITIHPDLRKTLQAAGVVTDRQVMNEGFVPRVVDLSRLTVGERKIYNAYPTLDRILGVGTTKPPIIFDELRLVDGRLKDNVAGYYDPTEDQIYIKRSSLRNVMEYARVYVHEKGHEVTKGNDPEDIFREFFESHLNSFVVTQLRIEERRPATESALSDAASQIAVAQGLLADLRAQRQEDEADLRRTQEALEHELRGTQETLGETRSELRDAQGALAETRSQLEEAKRELAEVQALTGQILFAPANSAGIFAGLAVFISTQWNALLRRASNEDESTNTDPDEFNPEDFAAGPLQRWWIRRQRRR